MRFLVLLIVSNFAFRSFSQDTTLIYLDQNWKKCKKSNAAYYRKLFNENNFWYAHDFYISGELQMTGRYVKKNLKIKDGDFTYYFEDGHKWYQISYKENLRNGKYQSWYENGSLKNKGEYLKDNKEGNWEEFYKDGKLRSNTNYVNNLYHGECTWFFENGQVSSLESYENGNLKTVEFWNEDGSDFISVPQIEIPAEFPGGQSELSAFLKDQVVYPNKALAKNIKGRVIIRFAINTEGEVTNIKVINSVHPILDSEALRVVKLLPNWEPAKVHNLPVYSYFSLPINFQPY
ncbi:MAG: TonB family protein [Flavobacteriia bacterium]|nr:TonB family protein [Flavobacteriia bacterium]